MSFLFRRSPINVMEGMMRFVNKPTRSTGRGKNVHISKRAQLGTSARNWSDTSQRLHTFLKLNPHPISPSPGLYHGKDVQFGKSIAPHSKTKTLKKWLPNVINKRVWSDTLDDWVRFKMTTTALKKIDYIGGIDNYLLSLDNKSVALSNYITKMRNIIGHHYS